MAETISLMAVGDMMLGSTYPDLRDMPPDDGKKSLAAVASTLRSADVTFGNLEGPLTEGGATGKSGANSFAFRTPPRYGRYYKDAGFDILNMANNHAGDFGTRGRESTRKTLDSLGIAHCGADSHDVARLTVRGARLAVVGFAHNPVALNVNRIPEARAAVAAAARSADIVMVSFHGGAEGAAHQHVPNGTETYFGEARGDLRHFAHAVIDAGAHLVVGHGPHVVRGMEFYRGRPIAYSLGNFATYGKFGLRGPTALSLILELQLSPTGDFLGGKIHPIRQVGKGIPQMDPSRQIIPILRNLSRADFGKFAATITPLGTLSAPKLV